MVLLFTLSEIHILFRQDPDSYRFMIAGKDRCIGTILSGRLRSHHATGSKIQFRLNDNTFEQSLRKRTVLPKRGMLKTDKTMKTFIPLIKLQ